MQETAERVREISEIDTAYEKMRTAESALKREPTDAEANLAIGRFRCFIKGDWIGGLPRLALGSDASLKALAMMELALPSTTDDQMKLANGWWDWSEKQTGSIQLQVRLRAAKWYQASDSTLSGLAKAMAEKRIADAVSANGLSQITGKWRVTYENREWSEYLIANDGTVTVLASSYREAGTKLKAERRHGWFWMDIASLGRQERFMLIGSKLVVQHWGSPGPPSVEKCLHAIGIRIAASP